jgi:CRP-like cAMP-binding protein
MTQVLQPDSLEHAYPALHNHMNKYARVDDSDFKAATPYFEQMLLKKNDHVVKSGARVEHTYWVWKGLLVSTYNDDAGKEHIVQFAIENCWITDQNAFYNRCSAGFNIVALEASMLLSISYDGREELCARVPSIHEFFRKKANDSFVKQQMRLITYLTSDAKRRYELLQSEYPGIYQRVPKKLLAGYLGVSRETLSRL